MLILLSNLSYILKQNPVIMLIEVKYLTSATSIKDWAIYHIRFLLY